MSVIKFGTDGWRARIGEEFTFDNLRKVAEATARVHLSLPGGGSRGMVVGYDARFLSREFAGVAAEVLASRGIPVFLSDSLVPTPAVSHAIVRERRAGGVMITASHNPFRYNGFKIKSPQGGSALPEVTRQVEEAVSSAGSGPRPKRAVRVRTVDILTPYLKRIASLVDIGRIRQSRLRAALDPMHGSGLGCYERLLGGSRIDLRMVRSSRDPLFGGVAPEPIEANMGALQRVVREGRCAIGISNDGDADRIGAVDGRGRFLYSFEIYALLLWHLARNKRMTGEVVYTVSTAGMVGRLARHFGCLSFVTPVGFKHIYKLMLERDVLIGGEESGGMGFKGHIPERDGLLAGLLLLELTVREGKRPEEILREIVRICGPSYYSRIDTHFPLALKDRLFARLVRVDTLDGAKYFFRDGSWLLFRGSGTEPLIRIYAESSSLDQVKGLLRAGQGILEQVKG
jgi:phosphomannomutase